MNFLLHFAVRVLAVSIAYVAFKITYRLKLHPLARFPGPRLAAVTSVYAAAYDLPLETSFCKQLPRLHDKYGPIVRIMPNELHIRDLDSFRQIYRPGTPFAKLKSFYSHHAIKGSFFNILETSKAKQVKDLYAPSFSHASIQKLEGAIHSKVHKLLKSLDEASTQSIPVDLSAAFRCLAADVVMGHCYQKNFGALDAPSFRFEPLIDLEGLLLKATLTSYLPKFFNLVASILERLPVAITRQLAPPVAAALKIKSDLKDQFETPTAESLNSRIPSIFTKVVGPGGVRSGLSPSLAELASDGLVMFGAGTETTSFTLTMGTWHLLRNPLSREALCRELFTAIPDMEEPELLSLIELETLPFLSAVIQETLRFSFGIPGRIPRVVPAEGAVFCGRKIPPGTAVSHSAYAYHMSEQYFEDAHSFRPERWLGRNSAELEKSLVSFSAGSRGCLGKNLAYAELYTTFAYIFRKFDFEVSGTSDHDMDWHDSYYAAFFGHLKVKVKRVNDKE